MPDYPKFGVWRDGYYMGDNNNGGNDIYVFEREADAHRRHSSCDGF